MRKGGVNLGLEGTNLVGRRKQRSRKTVDHKKKTREAKGSQTLVPQIIFH